jgi:hypothetical protein
MPKDEAKKFWEMRMGRIGRIEMTPEEIESG